MNRLQDKTFTSLSCAHSKTMCTTVIDITRNKPKSFVQRGMEKTSVEKKGKERDTMVPNTANFASCISNFRLRFWFSVSEIQLVETTTTRKNCRFIYSLEAKAFCQHLSLRITEALSCHVLKEKKSIYPLNERCVRKLLLYYSM